MIKASDFVITFDGIMYAVYLNGVWKYSAPTYEQCQKWIDWVNS